MYLKQHHVFSPHNNGRSRQKNPNPEGTWCAAKARHYMLYWRQAHLRRTIHWYPAVKVARTRSTPSYNSYWVFVAAC